MPKLALVVAVIAHAGVANADEPKTPAEAAAVVEKAVAEMAPNVTTRELVAGGKALRIAAKTKTPVLHLAFRISFPRTGDPDQAEVFGNLAGDSLRGPLKK
jgi:hypothetical protein